MGLDSVCFILIVIDQVNTFTLSPHSTRNRVHIVMLHVGSAVLRVGSVMLCVGSARLFKYQHVGIPNAKWSIRVHPQCEAPM